MSSYIMHPLVIENFSSIQLSPVAQTNCQAPFRDAITTVNAELYGYVWRNNSVILDFVVSKPENLPDSCTCGKWAHKNGCQCRTAENKSCKYCKCKGIDCCRNQWLFRIPQTPIIILAIFHTLISITTIYCTMTKGVQECEVIHSAHLDTKVAI